MHKFQHIADNIWLDNVKIFVFVLARSKEVRKSLNSLGSFWRMEGWDDSSIFGKSITHFIMVTKRLFQNKPLYWTKLGKLTPPPLCN